MRRARKKLVIYLTAGFPDDRAFLRAVEIADDLGVDGLEVGLPFSDPTADGPVIQASSQKAIRAGVNYDRVLKLSEKMRFRGERYLMTYANLLFIHGWRASFNALAKRGYRGAILPDVPFDEHPSIAPEAPAGFSLIPFLAPTTPSDRVRRMLASERRPPFIYMVSMRGITGVKAGGSRVETDVRRVVGLCRKHSSVPVLVGFGVQNGRAAERLASLADGVIVGSALIVALEKGLSAYERLLAELKRGIDRA